jgi:hypothetical protein
MRTNLIYTVQCRRILVAIAIHLIGSGVCSAQNSKDQSGGVTGTQSGQNIFNGPVLNVPPAIPRAHDETVQSARGDSYPFVVIVDTQYMINLDVGQATASYVMVQFQNNGSGPIYCSDAVADVLFSSRISMSKIPIYKDGVRMPSSKEFWPLGPFLPEGKPIVSNKMDIYRLIPTSNAAMIDKFKSGSVNMYYVGKFNCQTSDRSRFLIGFGLEFTGNDSAAQKFGGSTYNYIRKLHHLNR